MIRFFKVFYFLVITVVFLSCNKSDDATTEEYVVPFAEQYPKDLAAIENYLKTHEVSTPISNVGFPNDQDVTLTTVALGDAASIWGSNPTTPKATLLNKIVSYNGLDYKVYYLSLREGIKDRTTNVDSITVSYKGQLLNDVVFEDNSSVNSKFTLSGDFIQGWKSMFPLFKSGSVVANLDGSVTYDNFGVGVLFLPSALGYYNRVKGIIPAYSPLIFTIKLKEVNNVDNEFDRIDSINEDLNADLNPFNDDSDSDGIPNFIDIDDDFDYQPTKTEIKRPLRVGDPLTGNIAVDASNAIIYDGYYPYGESSDNPLTTIDERIGIPRKFTGPLANPNLPESATNRRRPQASDYTDPIRLRRHLDATCKFPYE